MQGQLFSQDFLTRGVLDTEPSRALDDGGALGRFETALRAVYAGLDASSTINEAQTESVVINKVLVELGWGDDFLPQVNLSGKRREDVPDCLLFADSAHKALALAETKDDQRYRHGLAILEAKRWLRPLDRGDSTEALDPDAPSSQMLRYLSRADVVSDRAVKWGILTNGNVWRLYWQDARSRSEEFFEVDVAAALGLSGIQHELDEIDPAHALRLFFLFFHRGAFLPQSWDDAGRNFHAYALNEARLYEEKVSQDLGKRVFEDIFPQLADALAKGDLHAQTHSIGYGQFTRAQYTPEYLDEVREAALVLLYRLLFLFYAEDRHLLPVRDPRYAPYSIRRIRQDVRDKVEARGMFSSTMTHIWRDIEGVCQLIDQGDDDIGMPAYNGGLFNRARSALLTRTKVPDKVMAPIIDALSRRTEDVLQGWINYRDLAVAHLGGIYERLLEYSLVHEVQAIDTYKDKPEINRIVAAPASFARKVSGSYYTHDDLVRLILRESIGQLAGQRHDRFAAHLKKLGKKASLNPGDWDALDAKDPASQILELKVCDPAMGSGHFLVALVDDIADRVLEAIATATETVNAQPWAAHLVEAGRPWQSPVLARISHIRRSIKTAAHTHGWAVTDAQLDDRHIVRRMILKKTIFGVDKNPMAVELAKTALWLHTFTVGAPLSFLDHHLQVGDSLHGERLPQVQQSLQNLGSLLLQSEFDRLAKAASNIAQVADLTDVDIAEAHLSKRLATEAQAQVAPILAVLDFWRALRWLVPGWPVAKAGQLARLLPPVDGQDNPLLQGITQLLDPSLNLVSVLGAGQLAGSTAAHQAASALMAQARQLATRETFFHWWTQFPTVFGGGDRANTAPRGFDAIIGNPPWDRIKLQEVEWFAERDVHIAAQARAADRKRLIGELKTKKSPLWQSYVQASERAEANARVLGNGKHGSGDYPLLGGGDVNLYSLFVERAQSLINPHGVVALITPSGIAADKGAAEFFRSISSTGKLHALFDFENRKVFFPDVDSRFKFSALVFGKAPRMTATEPPQPLPSRCAFYLHSLAELDKPGRVLSLSSNDFARVNPNTGASPIFRSQRDADITLKLYAKHPVLVKHGAMSEALGQQPDTKVWPVKYVTMFHMTNDSHLFMKASELKRQGWTPAAHNRWERTSDAGDTQVAVPLYEGKMVQMFDHRAADVVVNAANLHRAAQQEAISQVEKASPDRYPAPQFHVTASDVTTNPYEWALGYKEITAPTNVRSMIATMLPGVAFGNKVPLLIPQADTPPLAARVASLLVANFNVFAFDFVLRQKLQGQTINLFILEQLPVIAPARFDEPLPAAFTTAMRSAKLMNGHHPHPTVADFVLPQVLALTYTAHDMAPFARDMGYVDDQGQVLPPLEWNEDERRARMAALDAVFFYLYDLSPKDARYILDTFPIVREQDTRVFGHFKTQSDILALMPLLAH
ncbi:MAG: Eco57I restriction-modification methylase domain-containing protein [Rhodoferax sp.]